MLFNFMLGKRTSDTVRLNGDMAADSPQPSVHQLAAHVVSPRAGLNAPRCSHLPAARLNTRDLVRGTNEASHTFKGINSIPVAAFCRDMHPQQVTVAIEHSVENVSTSSAPSFGVFNGLCLQNKEMAETSRPASSLDSKSSVL